MDFIQEIKNKAAAKIKKIVLPETSDERTIQAAHKILQEGFANIILLGDKDEILAKYKNYNLDKAEFINPHNCKELDFLINLVVELRKHKGMDAKAAKELLLSDWLYFGAALVKANKADGMVAGAIHATSSVLRAALQIVGTAADSKVVSSCFIMVVPECEFGAKRESSGIFAFADCALIQNPSAEELAYIAIASAKSFESIINQKPCVAMLSHSTYGSAKHADVDKVIEATKLAKAKAPHLDIDGELQFDAAIVPSIGKSKAPDSSVAGRANVIVFPDLDAGNIGYKLVQRLAKAQAYGPITQGMASPINDLSRGCSSDDIVGVVALTALQAQSK